MLYLDSDVGRKDLAQRNDLLQITPFCGPCWQAHKGQLLGDF